MHEFKVGDRVRIVGKGNTEKRYGWHWDMDDMIGTVQTVGEISPYWPDAVRIENRSSKRTWNFHPSSLELVTELPLFEGEFWLLPAAVEDDHFAGGLYKTPTKNEKGVRVRVTEIREESDHRDEG